MIQPAAVSEDDAVDDVFFGLKGFEDFDFDAGGESMDGSPASFDASIFQEVRGVNIDAIECLAERSVFVDAEPSIFAFGYFDEAIPVIE